MRRQGLRTTVQFYGLAPSFLHFYHKTYQGGWWAAGAVTYKGSSHIARGSRA